MSHLVLTRFDELREPGIRSGRRWMKDIPPGWEVSGCVLEGLDPAYRLHLPQPDGRWSRRGWAERGEPNRLFLQRVCARMGC